MANKRRFYGRVNGDLKEESPQRIINRLAQQLSNTQRQLQMSEQIRSQLDKIRITSRELKDLTYKLLYDIADLSDKELEDLNKSEATKKSELKKLEQRLQLLRDIESNECQLNVKLLKYKKTDKNNALLINNKEVFVANSDDNVLNVVDDGQDTDVDDGSEYEAIPTSIRSRHSTNGTERGTVDSWHSIDLEGELNELSSKRTHRKRVSPERFESFPKNRSKRRSNGMTKGRH